MTTKIYLALALHNHQPVGNFDNVFAEAYDKAYRPMLAALERYPAVRLAIHNTGCLLDWLVVKRPEYIERLAALAARGQVEIMTGGYYEPILVSLPDADKVGQISKLTAFVKEKFGYEATGAWLAERVWEPHLPYALNEAGVSYTIVDDTHFRYAGLTDDDMFGYYVSEERGKTVKIFATAKHLRYTIPWVPVSEVIAWLREMAESELTPGLYDGKVKVAVMGDDGEKFGLWPRTYKHCWVDGWVDDFFSALEANQEWLTTIPPGEFAAQQPPLGRIYLPAASYDEMTEWAMPARLAGEIVHLKHDLQEQQRDDILKFIKGGLWRNFMVKYPEVNQMHKKALWVSGKVRQMPEGAARQKAEDRLWAAQCNCAYWHGLFGGIYLFHIRGINYRNLITAEQLADAELGQKGIHVAVTDFDRNGLDEIIVGNGRQWLMLDPDKGGALFEWDFRPAPYNVLNTMSRRPEGYHQDIKDAAAAGTIQLSAAEGAVENVHGTVVNVRELGLEKKLHIDWYRRGALQDHFLPPGATLESFARAEYGELGGFVNRPYTTDITEDADRATVTLRRNGGVWQGSFFVPVTVEKRLTLEADSDALAVSYRLRNDGGIPLKCRFGVENNWGVEGGQDPLTYFEWLDDEKGNRRGPGQMGAADDIRHFALVSEIITVRTRIDVAVDRPVAVWFFPLESVTNSEAGYERNYQGTSVMTHWPLDLGAGEGWTVNLRFALATVE